MKLTALALSGALAAGLAVPAAAREQAVDLFTFDQESGYGPFSGVVTDAHGTIFGTNPDGGNESCNGGAGCGRIYSALRRQDMQSPLFISAMMRSARCCLNAATAYRPTRIGLRFSTKAVGPSR